MLLDDVVTFKDTLWIFPLLMIVFMGLFFTIKFKGTQIMDFRESVRVTFERSEFRRSGVSSLKVFCITVGSRIGIGNIIGPILAILTGGPGAIFWMWVFSILGMATSVAEVTLGQIYKKRAEDGSFRGGTAYVIRHGLGMVRASKIMTGFLIFTYIVGGVSLCASGATAAFESAIQIDNAKLWVAIVFTLITAAVVIGGVQRVADASLYVVPFAVILWMGASLYVIAMSGGVIDAFMMIFSCAFNPPAALGGGIGIMLLVGMERGVLSNEAGIGTITNVSSLADVSHPVKQGLSQSLGIFIDILVCTVTSLVLLSSVDLHFLADTELESMALIIMVMEGELGPIVPIFVATCAFIFSFTTIISDYIIGEGNIMLLTEWKHSRYLIVGLLLVVVFVSSIFASDMMFVVVDLFYAICGVVNILVVSRLANSAIEAYRDYKEQRRRGVDDPVFDKDVLSNITGVTEWG